MSGVPIVATRSTPFYEEVLEAGLKYRWCRTIPLPKRFREGSREVGQLTLTAEEAELIAKNIVGVLRDNPPISERARQALARKMIKLGFVETAMCRSFREIYAEAIRRFRPGSTEILTSWT